MGRERGGSGAAAARLRPALDFDPRVVHAAGLQRREEELHGQDARAAGRLGAARAGAARRAQPRAQPLVAHDAGDVRRQRLACGARAFWGGEEAAGERR